MESRNTRQKYTVLKVIKENRNHPTIAEIYEQVEQVDPSIGQATVYRNVKKFLEDGKIHQIKTKTGATRYDYYKDHVHFECLQCGQITDIDDNELLQALTNRFSNRSEQITNYNLMLEGYCDKCK